MAEQEEISQQNYFKRLRAVLGLPIDPGRPKGMDTGVEETLWQNWSLWLQEQGYLPSAEPGEWAWRYIQYPISQALLRRADKERLRTLFAEEHWPQALHPEAVLSRIQQKSYYLSQHVRDLLEARGQRYGAVEDAIYDVYESWSEEPDLIDVDSSGIVSTSSLRAGLYRSEHPMDPYPTFHLYPKQRSRYHIDQIKVQVGTKIHVLREERPGWYMPLPEQVEDTDLNSGVKYPIDGPSPLHNLILPAIPFWILTPDPENPDFGSYATWENPSLGIPFLLLFHHALLPQVESLKESKFVAWQGEPRPVFPSGEWFELQDCMVIASTWSGIFIENQELIAALQPHTSLSISLAGGLRLPGGGGWIEGYGPQISIWSFYPEVDFRVLRVTEIGEVEISNSKESTQKANEPFYFQWPGAGLYRVEAYHGSDSAKQLVRIMEWEHLDSVLSGELLSVNINGMQISGALIEKGA
jgi:hypothetical protein